MKSGCILAISNGSTNVIYTSMKRLPKEKNSAQLNCFAHSSVKTGFKEEPVPPRAPGQAGNGLSMAVNSSPGPEAGHWLCASEFRAWAGPRVVFRQR